MDISEYNELSSLQHDGPYKLPEDFFVDGELDVDIMMETLIERGYVILPPDHDEESPIQLSPELKQDYPDVYDMIKTIVNNVEQHNLDKLVDSGILSMGIDNDGNATYHYTEDGAEFVNHFLD